jgi:hypothetical protein
VDAPAPQLELASFDSRLFRLFSLAALLFKCSL